MPNYSKQPFLTAIDEEYTMLIEVCEEFEKQKIDKTAREKSGNPTEMVLRFKFNELEGTTNVKNFAVIVLSETLLPPGTPFKWRFKEEVIGKKNCKIFTLVARQLYPPGGLYIKSNIVEMLQNRQMKKTEEFQQLTNYLQNL